MYTLTYFYIMLFYIILVHLNVLYIFIKIYTNIHARAYKHVPVRAAIQIEQLIKFHVTIKLPIKVRAGA